MMPVLAGVVLQVPKPGLPELNSTSRGREQCIDCEHSHPQVEVCYSRVWLLAQQLEPANPNNLGPMRSFGGYCLFRSCMALLGKSIATVS